MRKQLKTVLALFPLCLQFGCNQAPQLKPVELDRTTLVTKMDVFGEPSRMETGNGTTICKLSILSNAVHEAKVYFYFENRGKTRDYDLGFLLKERQTRFGRQESGDLPSKAFDADSQQKTFRLETAKKYAIEVSLKFSSSIPLDFGSVFEYSVDLTSSKGSIDHLVVQIPQRGGSISGLHLYGLGSTMELVEVPGK